MPDCYEVECREECGFVEIFETIESVPVVCPYCRAGISAEAKSRESVGEGHGKP